MSVSPHAVSGSRTDYLPDADLFIIAANRLRRARAPA